MATLCSFSLDFQKLQTVVLLGASNEIRHCCDCIMEIAQ